MSLRVFSSPSSFTQSVQFSRSTPAESKPAQPQFAGGTDSYSFSRKAAPETKPHFGSGESSSDRFLRNLDEFSNQGLLKYAQKKATEKGDLRADLDDANRALDKLEGKTLFEPEVRVLTDGQDHRPVTAQHTDPSGQHAFVVFKCWQVQDREVTRNRDGDFLIKRRTYIQPANDLIEGIDPSSDSRRFRVPAGMTHNPIYHWNEDR